MIFIKKLLSEPVPNIYKFFFCITFSFCKFDKIYLNPFSKLLLWPQTLVSKPKKGKREGFSFKRSLAFKGLKSWVVSSNWFLFFYFNRKKRSKKILLLFRQGEWVLSLRRVRKIAPINFLSRQIKKSLCAQP